MNHVCHISSVHPALDTRVFFKECRSLAQAGYSVTLIAIHDKEETRDGVHIIPFAKSKNRLKRILFSPFKMFSQARKQKAQVYHFHDPELLITGLLLRIFTRARVIYDIHEDYSKNFIDKPWIKSLVMRKFASKVFYFIERTLCRLMSANIVVLPHWKERYPKSVLVRNYPMTEPAAEKKDESLFVFVGTLGSKRSAVEMTDIFIKLSQLEPSVRFVIVGVFMEKSVESIVMEKIKQNPSIRYLGYHPFDEVKGILAQARYGFVLYSEIKYMENIPAKMYEYLASGVIPIFSSFDQYKYEVESEGWGIGVNPKNTENAARKIFEVMADGDRRASIDENIKRYKPVYSWESEKEELLACYAQQF